jgi:hypothetical protein
MSSAGDVLATGATTCEFGGDGVGGFEHVDVRERRNVLEHVYESTKGCECRLPLFHKEIRANQQAGESSQDRANSLRRCRSKARPERISGPASQAKTERTPYVATVREPDRSESAGRRRKPRPSELPPSLPF